MYSRLFLIRRIINKIEEGKPIYFVIPKEKRFSVSHQDNRISIFSYVGETIQLTKENISKVTEDLKVSNEELFEIVMELY